MFPLAIIMLAFILPVTLAVVLVMLVTDNVLVVLLNVKLALAPKLPLVSLNCTSVLLPAIGEPVYVTQSRFPAPSVASTCPVVPPVI